MNLDLPAEQRWSFLAQEPAFEDYRQRATGYLEHPGWGEHGKSRLENMVFISFHVIFTMISLNFALGTEEIHPEAPAPRGR